MRFTTAITNIEGGKEAIHGYDLQELTQKTSFVETIFLLLRGDLPNERETRMLNALLTAGIDHGPGTASAMTARIVASAKNSMHTALAAGILAMGERHGSAIEGAAQFFHDHAKEADLSGLVQGLKEKKVRIPGYGHAILEHDHRADTLLSIAQETDIYGDHCRCAEAVRDALNVVSSQPLPLNIDGAMAAILLDMGFPVSVMKGIFIIARIPGLVAQVHEEMNNDAGLRRLDEMDIDYTGPQKKSLS
ncbi:MAG TPA: citryl-CoA lyase [Candidatus Kapabacteria bacterium]|nr:citryl-CoA lyase [Candidatus Kapabacteria bacterium]